MRFPNFEKPWVKTFLSKYLIVSPLRNKDNIYNRNDVLSVSGELGIVNQIELLGRSYAGESLLPYHIVEKDDIVYTKSPLAEYPYGIIKTNRKVPGIVSTLYAVYKSTNLSNNRFVEHYFSLKSRTNNYLKPIVRIGAKHDMKIGNEEVLKNYVVFPAVEEQSKIADFLDILDKRISTQSKIIEDLELVKKGISNTVFGDKSVIKKSWKTAKLSTILKERKTYDIKDSVYPHATLSKEGINAKTDRYNRDFLVKDEEKEYKITHLNDICYNPANLKFGVICLNTFGDAIFSPIYVTYEIDKKCDPYFISLYLTNPTFIGHIRKYEQGTVYERMAVSSEDFLKGEINLPTYEEQLKIAKTFKSIDEKIAIEQAILNKLKEQKKFLLSNMFI